MKAVVVYESHWGNTARVAKAIADGIGPETLVLATDEADVSAVSGADLLVAGAPVLGFGLPTDRMEAAVANSGPSASTPPDTSHPSLRSWLSELPRGRGQGAAFETRVRWSPGAQPGQSSAASNGRLPDDGDSRQVPRDRPIWSAPEGRTRSGSALGSSPQGADRRGLTGPTIHPRPG